jgi:hypothetical protein
VNNAAHQPMKATTKAPMARKKSAKRCGMTKISRKATVSLRCLAGPAAMNCTAGGSANRGGAPAGNEG